MRSPAPRCAAARKTARALVAPGRCLRRAGALALLATLIAPSLIAQGGEHALSNVSFITLPHWRYSQSANGSSGVMETGDKTAYCMVAIHRGVATTHDPQRDFAKAWAGMIAKIVPEPLPADSALDGRTSRYAYKWYLVRSHVGDTTFYVQLYVLETGTDAIAVAVKSSSAEVYAKVQRELLAFLESIRGGGAGVASVQPHAGKGSLTMADLAGEWLPGEASNLKMYNSGTGGYAYSAVSGASYKIALDGSLTYHERGLDTDQSYFDKTTHGRVELSGDMLIVDRNDGTRVRNYRILGYDSAPDGSALLTIQWEHYDPDHWVRKPRPIPPGHDDGT